MRTVPRTRVVSIVLILLVALAASGLSAGCSLLGGANDRSEELKKAWAAFPGSADWDMQIRGVTSQSKSTGTEMGNYTIYLTTFTSKKVPGFAVYQTVDVHDTDSMDFGDRVAAFFTVVTGGSLFPGMKDPEAFMRWYAAEMKGLNFLRLRQDTGADGKSTWTLVATDAVPTASTLTGEGAKEIPLAFDEATGTWSRK
jgi:hypothetical protein